MKVLSLLALFGALIAQNLEISSSRIEYRGNHPLHAWVGVSIEAKGSVSYNQDSKTGSVKVEVPLNSFDSKVSSRDSNMLYYTEALDYPLVIFESDKVLIDKSTALIEGRLTFHGVTQKIFLTAAFNEDQKIVKGDFSILLSDYDVERPSLLFVKIDNKIDINYTFNLK